MTRFQHALSGLLVVTLVTPAAAQDGAAALAERVRAHVRYLAADAREGRGVGTAGLDSAAAHVARAFEAAGLRPGGTRGYYQPFTLDPSAPALVHANVGAARVKNVIGVLPGRGALAGETVVLGAHYDHLGLGGAFSLDPDSTGVVHNGADDNASGTAALIAAARLLAARRAPERRAFLFIAFTAEELGTIGSQHYVRHPTHPLGRTFAMINFDMVGRLRGDSLLVIGTGSAAELPALLDSVNGSYGFALGHTPDPWGRSDHSSFYAGGVPVVHFFTNTHADYHRTTDDSDKLNVDGIVRVASLAADLAWTLATRDTRLTFVEYQAPPPAAGGGYGAYLGTVPDMSGSPGGVRLSGVRAGSPAEAAGLATGDIIVKIGAFDVADLNAMTAALRHHEPGDTVAIVYLRDGERHETTATFGRRGG